MIEAPRLNPDGKSATTMLDDLKFIDQKDHTDVLGATLRSFRETKDVALAAEMPGWSADVPTADNLAKQIAQELMGRAVVIVSDDKYAPCAIEWQRAFQTVAQTVSFLQSTSDLDNVYLSWTGQPVDKIFAPILLRAVDESTEEVNSFEFLQKKLSGRWPGPVTVWLPAKSIDYGTALGRTVACYLGVLNGATLHYEKLLQKAK